MRAEHARRWLAHYLQQRGHTGPLSAMIEVTHRCHLACSHCYLPDNHRWQDKARELTTAELCAIIDQLRAAGCLFLTLTGGEVFLRKDILLVMGHARRLGAAVTLYTTGTLLTDAQIQELADLYPTRVELSLYSTDPAVHDGITQRPGSHAKTMSAMQRLRERDVPVRLKCPLMRQNIDSYPQLKALAETMGCSFLGDVTVTPMNDGNLGPVQYRVTEDQLVSFYSQPEIRRFAQVSKQLPQPDDTICGIGKRGCVIGPFGDVYACMGHRQPLGNLRQSSFADIWDCSPELRRLRALAARDVAVCGRCEKFAYCNRCAATAQAEEGDFFGPSAWSCHLAAAKERAAGLPFTPSKAQQLGLVEVVPRGEGFALRTLRQGAPAESAARGRQDCGSGGCSACTGDPRPVASPTGAG